jgi:hypothetical protein
VYRVERDAGGGGEEASSPAKSKSSVACWKAMIVGGWCGKVGWGWPG